MEEAEARAKGFECRLAFGAREEGAVDLASLFLLLHFASFLLRAYELWGGFGRRGLVVQNHLSSAGAELNLYCLSVLA